MERDLQVMDGFGMTTALRDFEKARRNRASTIRSAAVEDHGQRITEAKRGHGIERDVDGANASRTYSGADKKKGMKVYLKFICEA